MSSSKDGLLNQLKRQPGKAAGLGACLIMMIVIWGPMVFGGDDKEKKKPKPSPNAVSETSASSGGGAPNKKKATLASNSVSKAPAKPVKSFKEALDRLDQWRVPLGMEKAEPLTREVIAMRRQEAQRTAAARVALEESARKARCC